MQRIRAVTQGERVRRRGALRRPALWFVALASYDPTDPVWFFNAAPTHAPANFAGLVGAFVAEASFQLLGYASFLIPAC